MLGSIRRIIRRLKRNTSGNATLLVAMGMPVLIGSAGIAVDTAQWYMWKRELQYAVDQAALAGAWARANTTTQSSYTTRAQQEFTSNLSTLTTIASTPQVALANWNNGTNNSVVVTASAAKPLPFSSFLTGKTVTVTAFAQASFTAGIGYTACLIATSANDSGAITIGGSTVMTAQCGLAALSTSASSIVVNGNPTLDPGWVVSQGGIDSWISQYTDAEIHEYMTGLTDPFASYTTPTPSPNPAQTYTCVPGATTTTADKSYYTETWNYTYSGTQQNSMSLVSSTKLSTSGTSTQSNVTVPNGTTAGTATSTSTMTGSTTTNNNGKNKTYSRTDTVYITYTTYSNVVATTAPTQANLSQGTYSDLQVSCTTVFNPGVYVIDGGRLKITGQYQVTGAGVLFILKNKATIEIQGGSSISLTAASSSQLQNIGGFSAEQASKFAGMLVYEDRASAGTTNQNKLNGNSLTVLNGKIYLPKSDVTFSGTAQVTSQCLLITAKLITLAGTTNMTNFCPPGMQETDTVGSSVPKVRLVA